VTDFHERGPLSDNAKLAKFLTEKDRLAEFLMGKGLSPRASQEKAELFGKAATALMLFGSGQPTWDISAHFVPGRIEVLGKHTDYAGGRSVVAAAERGFCTIVWPRDDDQVTMTDAVRAETIDFRLHPNLVPRSDRWSNYPMTVARRVARNFPNARRGADITFASDLPRAAGMSSSSAMIVAVFLALADANALLAYGEPAELFDDPTKLAGYLACIENGQTFGALEGDCGVGTFGGSEDHTAILCAEPNKLSQFAYCPVEFELAIPMPAHYTFAIGASGVKAEKTGAAREKYNTASRLAAALVELWRRETGRNDPHLAAVLGSGPDAPAHFQRIVAAARETPFDAAALSKRLEHFMVESGQIIPAAGRALANGDLVTFGRLVDRSQHAAEQLLGNQVPETIHLAASARRLGATAASAFGAGFGGSVWALIPAAETDAFVAAWADDYRQKFPENAQTSSFFSTAAGPATFRVC
jgi:galactokinase